jgi:hypothetical protein
MKKSKSQPPSLERAYLAHFPLDSNIFNIFGYVRWKITKLFEVSKGIDHGQKSYNDPISLNVR